MKKLIAKIMTLVLSITALLTVFTGCDWITTNTDRDMAQVIATVQIDDSVESEDVYKRELAAGYISYGYQYVYYYSYTTSKTYETILDNLVTNKVVVQQAKIELAKHYNTILAQNDDDLREFDKYFKNNALVNKQVIDPKSSSNDNIKNYLTEYEYLSCWYSARNYINQLIDAYVDDDEDEEEEVTKEDATYTARTTPTVDEDSDYTEWELKTLCPTEDEYKKAFVTLEGKTVLGQQITTLDDLQGLFTATENDGVYGLNKAVYENYSIDLSTRERKKALTSFLSYLKKNGLILSTTKTISYSDNADNIFGYQYFADILTTRLQSALVSKYESYIADTVEVTFDGENYSKLWAQYKAEYEQQKALYENDLSSYETALGNVSDTSFVLYCPAEGYGYVLNLLIGFSDEQSTLLTNYQEKENVTNAEIEAYRKKLAEQIYAQDQRDTWVQSNYGKYSEGKFTFDSDYILGLDSVKEFKGEVIVASEEGVTEEDDDGVENTTWYFRSVIADKIGYNDFYNNYVKPIGLTSTDIFDTDALTGVSTLTLTDEIVTNFKDLMYAFSTDTGCLGKEYGYVYSPYTNSYVEEFAAAAKACVEKGEGAYTTVLTDYGYHIILCTKLFKEPYSIDEAGKTNFIADLTNKDSIAYKFREVKLDSVIDTEVTKISNKLVNDYLENNVTYYKSTYSDLITEESED